MTDAGGGGAREQLAIGGPMFEEPPEPPKPETKAPDNSAAQPLGSSSATNSWGASATLTQHFIDHGAEFGARSEGDYAQMAHEFYQRSEDSDYLRKVDNDGTTRIYDPRTNTFGAYNQDGTTRTFFKPSSNTYWGRQPGK